MLKRLLLTVIFSLSAFPAFAVTCTNPLPILNGSLATVNMKVLDDASGLGYCLYAFDILSGGTLDTDLKAPLATQASTVSVGGVGILANTGGGATPFTPFVPAATDNHQVLKNGAGTAYSIHASNNSATKNYLRLYDAGTAFNGCNSATGVIFAMEIPPTDSGFTVSLGGGMGIAFTNGLSICVTSGFGLTDTTAATATAMLISGSYK